MAATIDKRDRDKLPEQAHAVARQIEALGFDWTFNWEYPVPEPQDVQRIQIRDEGHVGQKTEVNLYAEAMKRGDKFPPGVVTKDGRIVDYNTRARAAHKLGWPTFPVFVLNTSFDDADKFDRDRLLMLGAAFNSGGPKPLTRAELTRIIRSAAEDEQWDSSKVAMHLSVKQSAVQSIFAQIRAEKRAAALNIDLNGSIPSSNLTTLGQRSPKLSDEVFSEIAQLQSDTGMSGKDLSDLCNRVDKVTSGDNDRVDLIAQERDARQTQIKHFKAGGKRRPPLSSRLSSYLDFIVQHESKPAELVDANPNTRDEYAAKVDRAISVLTALQAAQLESVAAES